MWLRSASTAFRALLLLCAIPFLSSCVHTRDFIGDCWAVRQDREHGVYSTAWSPSTCEQIEREQLEEAREIVKKADQRKTQQDRERLEEARRLVKEADQPKEHSEQPPIPKGGGQ
jgi:hypothetical protein